MMLQIKGQESSPQTILMENIKNGEVLREEDGTLHLSVHHGSTRRILHLSSANGHGWDHDSGICLHSKGKLKASPLPRGTKIVLEVTDQEEAEPIFRVKGSPLPSRPLKPGSKMPLGEIGVTSFGTKLFRFWDRLINFSGAWYPHDFELKDYPAYRPYPNGTLIYCEVE